MTQRGSALLTVLVVAALLAASAMSAALMVDLNLRLARQRADALAAESAVMSGAAAAEAALRRYLSATAGLPDALSLPAHPTVRYRSLAYRRSGAVAVVEIEGEGPGGARASATLEVVVEAGRASVRLHR